MRPLCRILIVKPHRMNESNRPFGPRSAAKTMHTWCFIFGIETIHFLSQLSANYVANMCCCTASRRRRSAAATGTSRSLLSLARALTPPLEDRTITIPRSDDYESDDEHDIEMDEHVAGGNNTTEEGGENDQPPNATSNTTPTSTFSTHTTTTSGGSTNVANELQLNALYNALQVATTIGNRSENGNGDGDADTIPVVSAAGSAAHVSSLLVQIGTLHLENNQVDMAANSFQSAIHILERTSDHATTDAVFHAGDSIRLCIETTALKSLGHIFFKKCHYQQAMSYFLRAHSKNNKTGSKGEILSDINILLAVACKHKASSEYRLSLDALLAASVGIEVAFGRFHELFVNVLVEAGSIFQRIGEADAAASLSQQVLIISQQMQEKQQEKEEVQRRQNHCEMRREPPLSCIGG